MSNRICIFCRQKPVDKNNEHVVPQWLIEYTGAANRSVVHGIKWLSGNPIEFPWESLCFPSCTACNSEYAALEGAVKPVVQALCERRPVSPQSYVVFLDWLDKVRVGLWLGHRYLQKNAMQIEPSFAISSRVASKDRMVAIYAIGDHQTGLNAFAAETALFQLQPSVFGLRVNNTLILNASWDWMCSSRCGYPYPRTQQIDFSLGALVAGRFRCRRRISHPIIRGLHPAWVVLAQPIFAPPPSPYAGGPSDADVEWCASREWPGRTHMGPLFRQLSHGTIELGAADAAVEFEDVPVEHAVPIGKLVEQTYSVQIESSQAYEEAGMTSEAGRQYAEMRRLAVKINKRYLRRLQMARSRI